jgi:uncharacterized protein YdhG (YjbR/CyaY superfamily)
MWLFMKTSIKFETVAQYFSTLSPEKRSKLAELRTIIKEAVPKAEEVISYNMPAFKQNKVLVYYAAFKNHIGFFPTSSPIELFKDELAKYKLSRGTVQFPLDKPFPKTLIKKIVKLRTEQDTAAAKKKPAQKR